MSRKVWVILNIFGISYVFKWTTVFSLFVQFCTDKEGKLYWLVSIFLSIQYWVMHKDYCNGTRSLVLSFHVLFLSGYWFSQLFRNFSFFPRSQSLISEDKIKKIIFDEWIVSWPMPWTNILVSNHIFIRHFFQELISYDRLWRFSKSFKNWFSSLNITSYERRVLVRC